MAKYYRRGHMVKTYFISSDYKWGRDLLAAVPETLNSSLMAEQWGSHTEFTKTMIIRGIGYRAFALNNNLLLPTPAFDADFENSLRPVYNIDSSESEILSLVQAVNFEFTNSRYMVVRAGHTMDFCVPLLEGSRIKTAKKDRKLVVLAKNIVVASNIGKRVWLYRKPSPYTGRGVRIKHGKPIRKAGKKDKQKGKAF